MDSSPLSRLPAELRNRIYELTFTNAPIELQWIFYRSGFHVRRPFDRRLGLALTATCKQIHEECGQRMFYAHNDFLITCNPGNRVDAMDYALVMRTFVHAVGLGNALAARRLILAKHSSTFMRLFAPAIEQLFPLCRETKLPLKIRLSGMISELVDMHNLRRTGNLVADELDVLSRPSNGRVKDHGGPILREACQRALEEEEEKVEKAEA
ncbi:hypothetical protein B0A55_11676 [Friedmanniomyces simplex]|uniref:Uncharacterized protein n=1 Tax=Friedmanniomyces simplex TaxID=329884 RepID=A0A4U0W506_9PEZI|nr:hypothetical protein B0A55_11676 [Friedmanniomyces simplex]